MQSFMGDINELRFTHPSQFAIVHILFQLVATMKLTGNQRALLLHLQQVLGSDTTECLRPTDVSSQRHDVASEFAAARLRVDEVAYFAE